MCFSVVGKYDGTAHNRRLSVGIACAAGDAAIGRQSETQLADITGSSPIDAGGHVSPLSFPSFNSSVGEHFEARRVVRQCGVQGCRHYLDDDYYARLPKVSNNLVVN